jgi:D-3-phosphoglycerate dehydrogenase
MSDWNILLTDGLKQQGKSILEGAADIGNVDNLEGISPQELKIKIPNYDAVIVRGRTKMNAEVIELGTSLKVIGRAGVGVDNIDLAAAQAKQITVVNSPMATTNAVAEHTLALMLSLVRFVPMADAAMKSGQWIKKQLIGTELDGKVLGIVGMGRIGTAVGVRAAAFGMGVLGYDPFLAEDEIMARGATPIDLVTLYRRADIVTLHLPLSPDTKNMVDGQALGTMKRGVRLVCAARGGIIEETALLSALESGQVAGAALDVFATEPPGLTALVAHPNVVATPHIGAQTGEAQVRAAQDIANEVLAALRNQPVRWKIV